MTGKRSMFQDLVLKSAGEVKFGGDQKGKVIGSGTISTGNSPSITNVLLVDGLAHKNQKVTCLMSVSEEQWVCHRRLGHASLRKISQINKLNLVRRLPNLKFKSDALCEACQKGKFSRPAFKFKNVVSSLRPLELLHIDLFGPVKITSVRGKKYGLVIVDDYSRWTWVKFLKHKDESHSVFFEFCTQIQSEKE